MLAADRLSDTIAAPATGPAHGAIAVIRVSGPKACQATLLLLSKNGKPLRLKPRNPQLAEILSEGRLVDRVIATYFKAPASYTGDDTVEISCHGSSYIVAKIMELLIASGARPAEPGEFSMRGFLNGKLDLAQAEGICDLIQAKTENAHRAAINLCEGVISRRFAAFKTAAVGILSEIEARLDDSGEELEALDTREISKAVKALAEETTALAATFSFGRIIKNGLFAAIAGAPNSGKSSLLNALAGHERAIVSHEPGTTRDTVDETIAIKNCAVVLTDTAGIRAHALDTAEQEGITRTKKAVEKADLVIFAADSASSGTDALKLAWDTVRTCAGGKKIIPVINKSDLAPRAKIKLPGWENPLRVSCLTGDGVQNLKNRIAENADAQNSNGEVITSARHYHALTRAGRQLEDALTLLSVEPVELELCAAHISAALKELETLLGETTAEDVLDQVFSRFCFGK